MALLLPDGHPHARFATRAPAAGARRIGIINIMPRLEAYEPYLLDALATRTSTGSTARSTPRSAKDRSMA